MVTFATVNQFNDKPDISKPQLPSYLRFVVQQLESMLPQDLNYPERRKVYG
jgi:hypothetical protein